MYADAQSDWVKIIITQSKLQRHI